MGVAARPRVGRVAGVFSTSPWQASLFFDGLSTRRPSRQDEINAIPDVVPDYNLSMIVKDSAAAATDAFFHCLEFVGVEVPDSTGGVVALDIPLIFGGQFSSIAANMNPVLNAVRARAPEPLAFLSFPPGATARAFRFMSVRPGATRAKISD